MSAEAARLVKLARQLLVEGPAAGDEGPWDMLREFVDLVETQDTVIDQQMRAIELLCEALDNEIGYPGCSGGPEHYLKKAADEKKERRGS